MCYALKINLSYKQTSPHLQPNRVLPLADPACLNSCFAESWYEIPFAEFPLNQLHRDKVSTVSGRDSILIQQLLSCCNNYKFQLVVWLLLLLNSLKKLNLNGHLPNCPSSSAWSSSFKYMNPKQNDKIITSLPSLSRSSLALLNLHVEFHKLLNLINQLHCDKVSTYSTIAAIHSC